MTYAKKLMWDQVPAFLDRLNDPEEGAELVAIAPYALNIQSDGVLVEVVQYLVWYVGREL
jgi:hypothetical protein